MPSRRKHAKGGVRANPFKNPTPGLQDMARRELANSGYRVELLPGRGVVRARGARFTVTLHFDWDVKNLPEVFNSAGSATVTPDAGEPLPDSVDFGPYVAALGWRIVSEPVAKTLRFPRDLPRVGKSLDLSFYERIVALHTRFTLEGHPNPSAAVAELARKAGHEDVGPDQARVWVSRGRKHLAERRGD